MQDVTRWRGDCTAVPGFEGEVQPEWTGFKNSESVRALLEKTAEHVARVARELAAEVVEESSTDALMQNRTGLASLGRGARQDVAEFTKAIAHANPTIAPEFLATAVKAVINLEKSKSGAALLQKLSIIQPDDVDGLDRLLDEWTVKDALRVLDEIDARVSVIETIRRIASDPTTDELHTLHPLVLRSRWLFGPEYESEEFCSNVTLPVFHLQALHARELASVVRDEDGRARGRGRRSVCPVSRWACLDGSATHEPARSSLPRRRRRGPPRVRAETHSALHALLRDDCSWTPHRQARRA
jgi:hypothetical protein